MSHLNPIARLDTHEVFNQPPAFEDQNIHALDAGLQLAVAKSGGAAHTEKLDELGRIAGSAEAMSWGAEANRQLPVLDNYDRHGQRIDEVRFHPAYHQLMQLGLDNGAAAVAWDGTPAGHVAHSAIMYLLTQLDSGVGCPMTMTYAAVPALRADARVADEWVPRVLASRYDPASRPASAKAGVTIGMGMTEKQGGSDVRANSTRADAVQGPGDDWVRLTGHKWFCSAPMSDAFLTLAYTSEGLGCFLLPRWLPDGSRNAGFRVMRLKDKMGDRSNASSEVEYHGALARRLGDPGRGVATIIQMVQHTRLDCVLGSAQQMRGALVQAIWHAAHRSAFQRKLVDQPAMTALLADLAIESEAATLMGFRLAQAFDADDPLARLLTPVAKYWVCKRAPGLVYEAMEALGGVGYLEDWPMARLFRQSPLNAIWEGSGNVIALDLLRAMHRDPDSLVALRDYLDSMRGRHPAYDQWLNAIEWEADEHRARLLAERLALAAQAAILLDWESPVADPFCTLRLQQRSLQYGAFDARIDCAAIVRRALSVF